MVKKLNFEEAMGRLEEIVRELEEGNAPLERSIQLYEEGMKLGKDCRVILEEAEQKVKRLSVDLEPEENDD